LWTANPDSDRVARIHASTLEVELFEGGHGPTFLSALPQGATAGGALVINEHSDDVSIFLTAEGGAIALEERLDVQEGASAWAVGRKGRYAIAWSQASDSSLPDIDGHQDLTLFEFDGTSVQSWMLAVGYRPSEVFIDRDEKRAFVVSVPGISVIDLQRHEVIRELFLPAPTLGVRDVEFSPDGSLAISRSEGSAEVLLIDTESSRIQTLEFPGNVSDLDMSDDGTLAIAVVRDMSLGEPDGSAGAAGEGGTMPTTTESLIALMDPKTMLDQPEFTSLYSAETVGSVVIAADASQAVLYTNASDSTLLSILDASTHTLRVVDVKAPLRAALLAEDGSFAVALMAPPPGSTKAGAFAIVPVAQDRPPRIEGTTTAPEFVSLSGEAGRALITTAVDSAGRAQAFLAEFPSLLVDRVALPSRPLATGLVLDADRGFVAQEHPEGRVTFVHLDGGQDETVTGFELAAKVVDQ
jgi:DNA-binding beta-propeller fold protein YncE